MQNQLAEARVEDVDDNMRVKTVTMKFGGTSVGSIAAIKNLIHIAQHARRPGVQNIVINVSAMGGVTDMLQSGILAAATGDSDLHHKIGRTIYEKHEAVLQVLAPDEVESVLAEIDVLIQGYVRFCDSVAVLGEVTPRALDYTMGLGERMSARQIAAVLRGAGIPSEAIDSTSIIVTDDCFQNAAPDLKLTCRNVQRVVAPVLRAGRVPVITGFIGATPEGICTTLGRGGSDYSAALIGVCLESDELWIWTDVDGVMSADPRIVPEAHTVETLTYREVGELAYYGAKVLHPKTIRPALEANIPIRVKNTFNPDHPGTLIVTDNGNNHHAVKAVTTMNNVGVVQIVRAVKAVTAVTDVGLITIEGKGMLGVPGIAARAFGAAAQTGTSVLLISQSSSEQSICFTVPCSNVETIVNALNDEFSREIERRDIDRVSSIGPLTIITVVGAGMRHTPGIAAQVFNAIAQSEVNVIAIAQGSSECSISFVVDDADTKSAVRSVHALTLAG
jgi:aspartokinase/homoserine dehydrogenase 1